MYYIVDITTGEVMGETPYREGVFDLIDDLTAMYPYENLEVQDGETSIPAIEWAA